MPTADWNRQIGIILRRRRRLLGLTQAQVASSCGVGLQQIHKYECGDSTIPAARLWHLARALGVDATYFFPPTPADGQGHGGSRLPDQTR